MREMLQIGFVRLKDTLTVFPVPKSTWCAGVKSGRYPQPVKLSTQTTTWKVEDIWKLIDDVSSGDQVR